MDAWMDKFSKICWPVEREIHTHTQRLLSTAPLAASLACQCGTDSRSTHSTATGGLHYSPLASSLAGQIKRRQARAYSAILRAAHGLLSLARSLSLSHLSCLHSPGRRSSIPLDNRCAPTPGSPVHLHSHRATVNVRRHPSS